MISTAKPQFLLVVLFCRYLFRVGIWVKEKERWLWRVFGGCGGRGCFLTTFEFGCRYY